MPASRRPSARKVSATPGSKSSLVGTLPTHAVARRIEANAAANNRCRCGIVFNRTAPPKPVSGYDIAGRKTSLPVRCLSLEGVLMSDSAALAVRKSDWLSAVRR